VLPSLGFQEIVVLAILALVVVGPKDLPLLLRKLGRWTARLRGMANEFRSGFDELARQAELDELRKEVDALRRHSSFSDLGTDLSRDFHAPLTDSPPAIPHDVAYTQQALPAPEVQPEPEQLADLEAHKPADDAPLRSAS
jgi:sec-independent protein translocase protein TatB